MNKEIVHPICIHVPQNLNVHKWGTRTISLNSEFILDREDLSMFCNNYEIVTPQGEILNSELSKAVAVNFLLPGEPPQVLKRIVHITVELLRKRQRLFNWNEGRVQ